ncbi:MAG: CoA transferase [Chloroflexi bacterium]|nr:CoA transferase [Chloroflexota bacterium]
MTALAGLRVLDLTRLLPGPYCTQLLGDLGADVIKVEEPGQGDPARALAGPLFGQVNRNKRSLTLNLKSDEGQSLLRRLVLDSDVLVESFRPGVMRRLGLDYDVLAEVQPRLIYATLSGFGQAGPYRARAGHDLTYVALAGLLGLNAAVDGAPVVPSAQVADLGGALLATVAILAAVVARSRTGRGQRVDTSLFEAALAWLPALLGSFVQLGRAPRPGEPLLGGALPRYDVYATSDGRYVALGALEDAFFAAFLARAGASELQSLPVVEQRRRLRELIRGRSRAEWVALMADVDTCFAPINTLDETLADPHVRDQGLLRWHNGSPELGAPFTLSDTPVVLDRRPPALGEHTQEVLATLGLDAAAVGELAARGVV